MTKKQKKLEKWSQVLDMIAGGENKSEFAKRNRRKNREVEMKKGKDKK